LKYRREIDGLRAVAVLPVILFHAGFTAFSGGFIGVDVFFVISGYLITTIILADKEKGEFSLVTFYERRARRILPALFFVMFCCIPFAWFWLLPNHLKDFSQSLVAVSAFSSNILFWRESGYFGTASELKPLLHTWSLAVEEQYYILFPLFIMFMWKFRKRWIFGSLMVIAVASLAVAQWGAYNKPTATFFLLPTRGWELAIGALIAFYFLYKKDHAILVASNKNISEFFGFVGIALIGYSVFAFDNSTPFPSFYALFPTIGTGLIIVFTTPQTLVGRFLGTKAMVGLGLISYSTYLWHQPLFVFARHRSLTEPSVTLLLTLSVASVIMAYFSWRYVEMPFRDKSIFNRKKIFSIAISGSVAFLGIGIVGNVENGFTERATSDQLSISSYNSYNRAPYYREGTCFLRPEQSYEEFSENCIGQEHSGSSEIMIWGDSHAAALSYGIRTVFGDVIQLTASGCPPLFDLEIDKRQECRDINRFSEEIISKYKPKLILLHADWVLYNDDWHVYNHEVLSGKIIGTLVKIRKISPMSRVAIVGSVPRWQGGLPNLLLNKRIVLDDVLSLPIDKDIYNSIISVDNVLKGSIKDSDTKFLSPVDLVCNGKLCPVVIKENNDYVLTAWDYAHLTAAGSNYFAEKIFAREISDLSHDLVNW